ncbi:MAG: hypothetical protein EPO65_09510 [Dehalococcoidia bacterium]|nr:MAG: hypothetical protein EPO65_09510 [Dehalococcoidia bacterium]
MAHFHEDDLHEVLDRWTGEGLISADQAEAIAAHERANRPEGVTHEGVSGGVLLQYAGSLVALGAMLGLYVTVLDDVSDWSRFGLMVGVAMVWTGLAWLLGRATAGAPAADALGFGAAVLWYAASLQAFAAIDWIGGEATPGQLRVTFLVTSLVGATAAYVAALKVPAPLAGLAAPVALAWGAGTFGWWVGNAGENAPGVGGAQVMVVVGFVLAALAFTEGSLRLDHRARTWWQIGALGIANIAAVFLAIGEGGAYEGLLFAYAVGLAVAAIAARQRVAVVFAAVSLYEYIGIVVFRTFEGAMAAIIILALIGLGTALGGTVAQRGGLHRFRFGR